MPDYTKVNAVAAADIVKINGVAVASIAECNGLSAPSVATGATRWVAIAEDGFVAYCSNSDRTSWLGYSSDTDGSGGQGTADGVEVAFGKNSSGAGIYVGSRVNTSRELSISGTDVTSTANWSVVDLGVDAGTGIGGTVYRQMAMQWGARSNGATAGTWMAVGHQAAEEIFRSTDGAANWTAIDLSGITNHNTTQFIRGIASDGSGNWMTLQGLNGGRIYYSTNDGASFASSSPFTFGRGHAIAYTNSTWVAVYARSNKIYVRTCADSDITTWSNEVQLLGVPNLTQEQQKISIAAAGGKCCVVGEGSSNVISFSVNGTTDPTSVKTSLSMNQDTLFDVATDGTTWLLATKDADVWEANQTDLTSWTQIVNGIHFNADGSDKNDKDLRGICADVVLPL
jgi:hypothetical protein